MDFGVSGADDLVGGPEDFLGALFGYRFGVRSTATAEPILYIAASIIGSLKAQRFATKKRYGFGFDFTQTAGCRFVVGEIAVVGVKNYVSQFVKKCLVRQLRKRVNCDLTLAGLCGQVSYVAPSFSSQLLAASQRTERHISSRLRVRVGTSLSSFHRLDRLVSSQIARALAFVSS